MYTTQPDIPLEKITGCLLFMKYRQREREREREDKRVKKHGSDEETIPHITHSCKNLVLKKRLICTTQDEKYNTYWDLMLTN
jgi:hypothetical protein